MVFFLKRKQGFIQETPSFNSGKGMLHIGHLYHRKIKAETEKP